MLMFMLMSKCEPALKETKLSELYVTPKKRCHFKRNELDFQLLFRKVALASTLDSRKCMRVKILTEKETYSMLIVISSSEP